MRNVVEYSTPINASAADYTTDPISIEGAKKVTMMITRASHSSGSSAVSVDVSLDGTTFVDYKKLIDNVANTNSQTITRVASKTLSANGSDFVSMDLEYDSFKSMKITNDITTDGNTTVKLIIER